MTTPILKVFVKKEDLHNRFQKNQSCVVYNVTKGGNYRKAAVNAWGISDNEEIIDFTNIIGSPHPKQLEVPSNSPNELGVSHISIFPRNAS